MPESHLPTPLEPALTREIIAEFASRIAFETAVTRLLADGFERTDLSVLASHDSLDIAGVHTAEVPELSDNVGAAIGSQLPWLGPIAIAGVLLTAAGPVGLAIAAIAGTAAGAVALRPVFDELMEEVHAERFTQSVAEGGILLWVRIPAADKVEPAERILRESGAVEVTRLAQVGLETL